MSTCGVYNRDGEALGYLVGDQMYDPDGDLVGTRRGNTVYDLDGERRWLVDHDALLDLRGNVIGYLGTTVAHDR
jgi:hypothetical protein